jgi:hypothetical protein
MREFMRLGDMPGPAHALEAALDSWSGAQREYGNDILYDKTTKDKNAAAVAVRNMAESAYEGIDRSDPPVLVEKGLSAKTPSGELMVTSTIDQFLQSRRLNDCKTGRNRPNGYHQMGMQSLVVRAQGHEVRGLDFEYVPRRREKTPAEIIEIDQVAAEQMTHETLRNMSRDIQLWRETGDPSVFQARPGSYLCDANYCPAFGSTWCGAWRLKRKRNGTNQ